MGSAQCHWLSEALHSILNTPSPDGFSSDVLSTFVICSYAELTSRIHKLQWEWDIERVIEAAAAGIILIATLVIGVMRRHTWLGLCLAAAEASFIMLHATYGWCPPQPVLRKFGFRTVSI